MRARTGHGHDATLMNYKVGDAFMTALECMSADTLVAVGSNGRAYSISVSQLPSARGDGLPVASFIELEAGTDIVGYLAGSGEETVVLVTDNGFGLKCRLKDLFSRMKAGRTFVKTDDGARVMPPLRTTAATPKLACLSEEGRLLVFDLEELRELNGGGKGVILMGLNDGEKLTAVLPVSDAGCIVTGQGRSTVRQKTLVKNEWLEFFGRRARKGTVLAIRFTATGLAPLPKKDDGAVAEEKDLEPKLF